MGSYFEGHCCKVIARYVHIYIERGQLGNGCLLDGSVNLCER